ncbi:hypothetical protein JCM9279_004474 [Rhodotorula babjevae]
MGKRSRNRDLSDSPSSSSARSASDDDSPPSTDSDSSRHARSRRHDKDVDGSVEDTSSGSSESEDDDRQRRRPRGGGTRRRRRHDDDDDSSDEEALIAAQHHRDRRRRRAAAVSPRPAGGGNKLLIGGAILILFLALGGGAWWWFNRDSAGSTPSSSSGESSSGSTGSAASGSAVSAGAGTSGDGADGSGDGEAGSAAGAASRGSSAGGGGGSASGASQTASGGSSASAAPSGSSLSGNSSTGGTASGGGSGGSGKVAAFWENWTGLSVADTDFSGYDYCFWFCAVPGTAEEKGKLTMGESTDGVAKDWVKAAQAAGCKAMLSIGGWSGSNTFSGLVATDTSRADFFDTANDLKNYLEFFKTLRAKIGSDKFISSDTSSGPWTGADGSPSTDLSEFGNVLDFITIMTYNAVTYSAAATGPNFALDSSCAPSTQQFSYPAAVKSWTAAKFPANKIMLGLASYGYAWKVDSFTDGGGVDGATSSIYQKASGTLSASDGSKPYDKIISDFKKDMDYTFDDCSKTPFLYSSSSQLLITYDDADSFAVKGAVAGEGGLMGCSLYAALTQNTDGTLRDAAKRVC